MESLEQKNTLSEIINRPNSIIEVTEEADELEDRSIKSILSKKE